jgi:DNA-binding LacI/PurR family transcriptional regulator
MYRSTGGRRATTIHDVAERAGVSKSTVSNVIRGAPGVGAKIRERVEQAIAELGYTPSAVARSLVHARTDALGAVVPDLGHPFYGDLLRGVERTCASEGFRLIISTTEGRVGDESQIVNGLIVFRCDGYLLCGLSDWSAVGRLEGSGLPVVLVDTPRRDGFAATVTVDDRLGALLGTRHLISLGHTRIASVLDSETVSERGNRVSGYIRALEEAGIPVDDRLLLRDRRPPGTREPAPRSALAERILGLEPRPTAVITGDDMAAIGIIDALEARGARVPTEISVVGFDDDAVAGVGRIGLTTVRQPATLMGELGARILIRHLRGEDTRPLSDVRELLEPELVVRASTAPPPP